MLCHDSSVTRNEDAHRFALEATSVVDLDRDRSEGGDGLLGEPLQVGTNRDIGRDGDHPTAQQLDLTGHLRQRLRAGGCRYANDRG